MVSRQSFTVEQAALRDLSIIARASRLRAPSNKAGMRDRHACRKASVAASLGENLATARSTATLLGVSPARRRALQPVGERIPDVDRAARLVDAADVAHPGRDRERQARDGPAGGQVVGDGAEDALRQLLRCRPWRSARCGAGCRGWRSARAARRCRRPVLSLGRRERRHDLFAPELADKVGEGRSATVSAIVSCPAR